jgi:rhomboid protease GluP
MPQRFKGSFRFSEPHPSSPRGHRTFDTLATQEMGAAVRWSAEIDPERIVLRPRIQPAVAVVGLVILLLIGLGMAFLWVTLHHDALSEPDPGKGSVGPFLVAFTAALLLWLFLNGLAARRAKRNTRNFRLSDVVNVGVAGRDVSFAALASSGATDLISGGQPQADCAPSTQLERARGTLMSVLKARLGALAPAGGSSPLEIRECVLVQFRAANGQQAAAMAELLPGTRAVVRDREREASEREEQDAAKFARRLTAATPRVWVNWLLIGLNAAALLATLADRAAGSSSLLWGANYGPLTASGQWWRLLTGCFVQVDLGLGIVTMLFLLQAGGLVERLFGSRFYSALYLVSGVAGNLVSIWESPWRYSAGASAAILGVGGALVAYWARRCEKLPPNILAPFGMSVLILVSCFLSAMTADEPRVSLSGSVGGFLAGLILGWVAARPLDLAKRENLALRRATALALVSVMLVSGLFLQVRTARVPTREADANRALATMRLARHGDPAAQGMLGLQFANGEGLPKDLRAAAAWYRRAAQQGDVKTQRELGLLLAGHPLGIPKNDVEAYQWLTVAGGDNTELALRVLRPTMKEADISTAEKLAAEFRTRKQ